MLQVQKHRGPDDSGIRIFSLENGISFEPDPDERIDVAGNFEGMLGFNRLSILDLSTNGHQPMASPDGQVIIALNGEIYNAFDFKDDLAKWGYRFRSKTDTEVVLALYLRHRLEKMLTLLNGMFAIVIIDLNLKKIFIARDRFGIKPLYYVSDNSCFAFSSELKSFRFLDRFSYELDDQQIDEFLLFRNNLSGSLFGNVHSLTPGYYVSFSHRDGVRKHRYFDINSYTRTNGLSGPVEHYEATLNGWLSECVERQLISDVRIGCQLSGGIDSSMVTLLAAKLNPDNKPEAFSVIFDNKTFSEESYIDIATEKTGINTHKFKLNPDYYLENIERATWHLETPLNHQNTIGIYYLSQQAKKFVTVLLSGEGSDEVFGGYERFGELKYPYRLRLLLHHLKLQYSNKRFLTGYFDSSFRAVALSAFMTPRIAGILKGDFDYNQLVEMRRTLYNTLSGSWFDRQLKYEMISYLPDLLIRQDKMSMAHSVENRVPFLDNTLVQNSYDIPEELLLPGKRQEGSGIHKYLLKRVASQPFGNEFAFRDKMGFGIPVREFLTERQFTLYLKDKVLPGIRKRGLFNHSVIGGWIENLNTIRIQELDSLWIMLAFEIWASIYLDGDYENWNT